MTTNIEERTINADEFQRMLSILADKKENPRSYCKHSTLNKSYSYPITNVCYGCKTQNQKDKSCYKLN